MEVTKKSTDKWVDKEELLHVQMEYELVKKGNNAICSTKNESRGNHTTCSKWESERHISYHNRYSCYLKIDTNEDISTEKGNHRFTTKTYGSPNGKVWGLDAFGYSG